MIRCKKTLGATCRVLLHYCIFLGHLQAKSCVTIDSNNVPVGGVHGRVNGGARAVLRVPSAEAVCWELVVAARTDSVSGSLQRSLRRQKGNGPAALVFPAIRVKSGDMKAFAIWWCSVLVSASRCVPNMSRGEHTTDAAKVNRVSPKRLSPRLRVCLDTQAGHGVWCGTIER